MYKLLIVDDESVIVQGLHQMLSQYDELELDVHKCYSSVNAMNLIKSLGIDIVILDINMPILNGIDLANNIVLEYPEIKFIFLTGHNSYEYLYSALKLKVVDFISKLEDDEKLILAVKKAIEEIKCESNIKNKIKASEAKFLNQKSLFEQWFFAELLQGHIEEDKIENMLLELETNFVYTKDIFLVVTKAPYEFSLQKTTEILFFINEIFKEKIEKGSGAYQGVICKDTLAFIIQVDRVEHDFNYIKNILNTIERSIMESYGISFSFCLTKDKITWADISKKHLILKQLKDEYANLDEGIITDTMFKYRTKQSELEIDYNINLQSIKVKKTMLPEYIACKDTLSIDNFYSELSAVFEKDVSLNFTPLIECYMMVSVELLSYINTNKLIETVVFKIPLHSLYSLKDFNSWDDTISYLKKLTCILVETVKVEVENDILNFVVKVKGYIIDNIGEELTLTRLSDVFDTNPTYLSKIFAQYSDTNLHEFIINNKLELAKKLLANSELKIKDIVRYIDFDSSGYFTKVFKKKEGITPTEYREKIKNG